jgi:hypothetical protein
MPLYTILATRETKFEFVIEADSELEALDEMQRIDDTEDSDEYAYEYSAFEVTDVNVEGVLA